MSPGQPHPPTRAPGALVEAALCEAGTVFVPGWEDNPTWKGAGICTDLRTAQQLAADAYAKAVQDEKARVPAGLGWRPGTTGTEWELTAGGECTPVTVTARRLWGRQQEGAVPFADEQLALAATFRIPLPFGSAGGHTAIVVVRAEDHGQQFAVTNGASFGLEAWIEHQGWRAVSTVGRAAAFRYTRTQALDVALRVADLEGACYRVTASQPLGAERKRPV
jgi:hypothetical protein